MQPREIDDEEYVSQRVYVDDDGELQVLNKPRPQDNDRLSVIRGRISAAEAYRRVRRQARKIPPCGNDGVRHAKVGDLRRAGFVVEHEPTQRNPEHATVRWGSVWDGRVAEIYGECFSAALWHDEGQER